MGARGPKPESHNKVVGIDGMSEKRPTPPKNMSPAARKLWKEIVEREKSSHFKAGDLPLLRAYCEAEALHLKATAAIQEEGAVLSITKPEVGPDGNSVIHRVVSSRKNPWCDIQTSSAHTMAQLATKLRLCRNARVSGWKEGGEKETPKSTRKNLMFGGKG